MKKSQQQNGKGTSRRNGPPKASKPKQNFQIQKAPVAQSRKMKSNKPKIETKANGDIVIRHRELVKDIDSSIVFAANYLPINPARPVTFPWLSNIAINYESYKFKRLGFDFMTSSSTTATGKVMIAVDYDASDQPPKDKVEAMAWRGTVSCAAWEFCHHKSLEEDLNKQKSWFVRYDSPPGGDIRLNDVGSVYVCTQGQATAGAPIGELYVDYEIKLMTPDMSNRGAGTSRSQIRSGTSNASPFGTRLRGDNNLLTYSATGTTTSFTSLVFHQPFEGEVMISVVGTGLTGTATLGGSATASALSYSVVNGAATSMILVIRLDVTTGQSLIIEIANVTMSNNNMWITQGETYA